MSGNFLTVRDPPYGEQLEIFPNVVFDSSNKAFWDTERSAKNAALYEAPFLKKSGKTA